MSRYECCYSSGRQFVFTERARFWSLAGHQVTVCLALFALGLYIFCFISLAGVASFEVVIFGMAFYAARSAYRLSFSGKSNTVDLVVYTVMVITAAGFLAVFLSSIRLLLTLEASAGSRCMLFSAAIMVFGFLLYSYLSLMGSEDERKHHLRLCNTEGCTLEGMELGCHREEQKEGGFMVYARFLEWIISWRWWLDLQDVGTASEEECRSAGNVITVHNHTLKLIKVCFYSPEDMLCWVPFGGVSGRCVGLIGAGSCRSFHLQPPAAGEDSSGPLRLKVFQPGLLDKELACIPKASRGQSFAFHDVEGMVRLSSRLSNPRSPPATPAAICIAESSEDESRPMTPRTGSSADLVTQRLSPSRLSPSLSTQRLSPIQARCPSIGDMDLLRLGHRDSGLARRHSSSDNLQRLAEWAANGADDHPAACCEQEDSHSPVHKDKEDRMEFRRAGPDEVVVRNRSRQEICARLFRSNDFCYIVPLVGKFTACGDCILTDSERRFNPRNTSDREFTLKVYSVGAGARELTYLTVSRGHAYTFCDSLLS